MSDVELKGRADGIDLILPKDISFDEISAQTKWHFLENKAFFKGGKININIKGDISTSEEEILKAEIRKILKDTYVVFNSSVKIERDFLSQFLEKDESVAVMKRGTVRSGERVTSRGAIVVFGNVNPGAELIAKDDIVVLGALRGMAHAGCEGDENAMVCALCLRPTQIRIADIFTYPPDTEDEMPPIPEVAFVNKNKIYIHEI